MELDAGRPPWIRGLSVEASRTATCTEAYVEASPSGGLTSSRAARMVKMVKYGTYAPAIPRIRVSREEVCREGRHPRSAAP